MARGDILAGLRNALERGESLEEAKESLINAGYSREEVEEATAVAGRAEEMMEVEEVAPVPKGAAEEWKKPKKASPFLVTVLVITAAVIIIGVATYFFLIKK